MSSFEERWSHLARAARPAPAEPVELPAGLAARVRALAQVSPEEVRSAHWLSLSRRALWGACAALLVCALVDYSGRSTPQDIRPPVEMVVLDVISSL